MQIIRTILALSFCLLIGKDFSKPMPPFSENTTPPKPDYSNPLFWSALPYRPDAADFTLKREQWISDSLKPVDVFYIYPTFYTRGSSWNANLCKNSLNRRIDFLPVKLQASIFNKVARVYVPRYRQAILKSYTDTTGNGKMAFELAYQDVKEAFEYYLKHYNNGRPIVIVSHSQGTTHSKRLLQDFFDTPIMKEQLVAAYTIGMEMYREEFKVLMPCEFELQNHCYVTWASYKAGSEEKNRLNIKLYGNVCVNPISWKIDSLVAQSKGGILLNPNKKRKFKSKVYIANNFLNVKTNMIFMKHKNFLHLVDMNLFWFDIRNNFEKRVDAYLKATKKNE